MAMSTKQKFRCLPRPWNKAEKIAVVNSFSSMWLEINSAFAAEGQAPITVGKPNLKPPPRKINAIFDSQL